jgi:hypothetical protein
MAQDNAQAAAPEQPVSTAPQSALDKAWREYLKIYPYTTTEWRDSWDAFKWAWEAAWKEAAKMVEDN